MKILDVTQSGSLGGNTSSHNRYGQYRRRRATPVNPRSTSQGVVRARMSLNAAAWRTLTDNQRAGWRDLGAEITRSDSMGQTHTMTGFNCYCMVNNNKLAAGDSVLTDAPAVTTPTPPTTVTITLTSAALSVAYTPTPLAAGTRLFTYCSGQLSAGRLFNKNVRLLAVSAAAAASPANLFAAYSAKFGVPVTGQRVFFSFKLYLGGFLSGPLAVSQVIA
jgi:hypothetical protein